MYHRLPADSLQAVYDVPRTDLPYMSCRGCERATASQVPCKHPSCMTGTPAHGYGQHAVLLYMVSSQVHRSGAIPFHVRQVVG